MKAVDQGVGLATLVRQAMAMASSWRRMLTCTSRDRESCLECEAGAGRRGTPADDTRAWANRKQALFMHGHCGFGPSAWTSLLLGQ